MSKTLHIPSDSLMITHGMYDYDPQLTDDDEAPKPCKTCPAN